MCTCVYFVLCILMFCERKSSVYTARWAANGHFLSNLLTSKIKLSVQSWRKIYFGSVMVGSSNLALNLIILCLCFKLIVYVYIYILSSWRLQGISLKINLKFHLRLHTCFIVICSSITYFVVTNINTGNVIRLIVNIFISNTIRGHNVFTNHVQELKF